jgi:conjugal transfer pilin signal peptidase TrbI
MSIRSLFANGDIKRWSWWKRGLRKSGTALLIVGVLLGIPSYWMIGRYTFAFDAIEGEHCLPFQLYIVDLTDKRVERGGYLMFEASKMEPFYKNGTHALKRIDGVEGDHVQVTKDGAFVNGKFEGPMTHVEPDGRLWRMGKRIEDYKRDEFVPKGKVWVAGSHVRSYDSRYWGYVEAKEILGRAHPIY